MAQYAANCSRRSQAFRSRNHERPPRSDRWVIFSRDAGEKEGLAGSVYTLLSAAPCCKAVDLVLGSKGFSCSTADECGDERTFTAHHPSVSSAGQLKFSTTPPSGLPPLRGEAVDLSLASGFI